MLKTTIPYKSLLVLFWLFATKANGLNQDTVLAQQLIHSSWDMRLKDPEEAKELLERSLLHFNPSEHPILYANYLNKKGGIQGIQGAHDSALFYFFEGLKIRESLQEDLAKSYLNISCFYLNISEDEKAYEFLKKGLGYAQNDGDSLIQAAFYGNLGNYFVNIERYDSAIFFFHQSLSINSMLDAPISTDYSAIGSTYIDMNELDSGLYYSLRAMEHAIEDSILYDQCDALNNIGLVYYYKENYQQSIVYAQRGRDKAKALEDAANLSFSNELLYLSHKKLNNKDQALIYLEEFKDLEYSILEQQANENLLKLQTQFETQEKNRKIQELKIDNLLKQQTLNQLYLISGSLLILLLLLGVIYALYRQKQKNKLLQSQKEIDDLIRSKELERVNAMLSGQEKERKRIAEALHDQIGSLLSTVKHYLSSVDQEHKNELIYKAEIQLDSAVEEMRKISHNLVSGVLVKFGLVAAVKDLAHTLQGSRTMKVKVITLGFDERLNNEMEIYIYRILQELVSNTLKHAKAKEISIHLKQSQEHVKLIYSDHGVGFDPLTLDKNKTTGINNIIQRVELKNGNISIESSPGNGCKIKVELPYQ